MIGWIVMDSRRKDVIEEVCNKSHALKKRAINQRKKFPRRRGRNASIEREKRSMRRKANERLRRQMQN